MSQRPKGTRPFVVWRGWAIVDQETGAFVAKPDDRLQEPLLYARKAWAAAQVGKGGAVVWVELQPVSR